ncbi:uncharacterized protein LOC111393161 isoform X2 [Olea europaea var. sylvestris]|nr:uncharacterized protein LOC111393161 isoform X2 [Olea europaea var. sylvestris]
MTLIVKNERSVSTIVLLKKGKLAVFCFPFSYPNLNFYLEQVLVEPGTPQGSNIISQMRSHILWMEKRRSRKLKNAANKASNDLMTRKTGAFVVAPCPHDGARPLQNTDKYCHFVQRLRGHHHSEHTRFSVSLCLPPWE